MALKSRIPAVIARLEPGMQTATRTAAGVIADAAKQRVPVRTGRLHDAIHVEQQPEGAYVVAGDSKAFYGHIIEHGGVHTPAHPFLIPALEESRVRVVAATAAVLRKL